LLVIFYDLCRIANASSSAIDRNAALPTVREDCLSEIKNLILTQYKKSVWQSKQLFC
jgi:hypothetical protein